LKPPIVRAPAESQVHVQRSLQQLAERDPHTSSPMQLVALRPGELVSGAAAITTAMQAQEVNQPASRAVQPSSVYLPGQGGTLHATGTIASLEPGGSAGASSTNRTQLVLLGICSLFGRTERKSVVDKEATEAAQAEADKDAAEEGEEAKPVPPVMKTTEEVKTEWEVQNDNKPLWTLNPKEVSAPLGVFAFSPRYGLWTSGCDRIPNP
jgi:Hsp90 protein